MAISTVRLRAQEAYPPKVRSVARGWLYCAGGSSTNKVIGAADESRARKCASSRVAHNGDGLAQRVVVAILGDQRKRGLLSAPAVAPRHQAAIGRDVVRRNPNRAHNVGQRVLFPAHAVERISPQDKAVRLGQGRDPAAAVGQPEGRRDITRRQSLCAKQFQCLMMRLIEDRGVAHLARDRCFQVATACVDGFLLRNTRTRPDGVPVRAEEGCFFSSVI
jgi:hypothetical protein